MRGAQGPDVPREVIAEILEREIEKRRDRDLPRTVDPMVTKTAEAIAATTGVNAAAVARRISAIRHPVYTNKYGKVVEQKTVKFETADMILTGLDLTDLWQSEPRLAAVLPHRNGHVPEQCWCAHCREWTLGKTCGWCNRRTLTPRTMVRRKAAGKCELCGYKARGMVGGHRLCNKHVLFWPQLGATAETRLEQELEMAA